MRAFVIGTLASVALGLGVTSNASADWRYRERVRFEHGRRIVFHERYWIPPVVIAPPAPVIVPPPVVVTPPAPVVITTPAPVVTTPPVVVTPPAPIPVGVSVISTPVYSTYPYGYYGPYGYYRR
jgi:hypothetical protein